MQTVLPPLLLQVNIVQKRWLLVDAAFVIAAGSTFTIATGKANVTEAPP